MRHRWITSISCGLFVAFLTLATGASIEAAGYPFSDDFEGGLAAWTADPPWAETTAFYASPVYSVTDSPSTFYAASTDASLTLATSVDLSAEIDGPLADPGSPDPSRDAVGRETRHQVREVLERLDPLWRLVLYLRDGLDFSYAEIAEVAARSEDVVRVTLHRARRRVREALERSVTGGMNHEPL